MHDLHQLDQSVEELAYRNATIATLHQMGKLSRLEAEALDILDTSFTTEFQEDQSPDAEMSIVESQIEHAYIAIIDEGSIMPILNLEEMRQHPNSLTERLLLSKHITSAIFDAILVFLEEEGGEDDESSGPI